MTTTFIVSVILCLVIISLVVVVCLYSWSGWKRDYEEDDYYSGDWPL